MVGNESPAPGASHRSEERREQQALGAGASDLAHPAGHHEVDHAAEHHEEVFAPDQLKPAPFRRLTLFAAFATIICLPVMAFVGNHEGNVETVILTGIAGLILLGIIVGFFLRKAGLRS